MSTKQPPPLALATVLSLVAALGGSGCSAAAATEADAARLGDVGPGPDGGADTAALGDVGPGPDGGTDAAPRDGAADAGADAAADAGPPLCNGYASLCGRRLDQVTLPATHNSMASEAEGFAVANQHVGLARQLDDGIRGLLFDVYEWEDPDDPDGAPGLWLCHGLCQIGATPAGPWLGTLAAFLEDHPREVVVAIIEDHAPAGLITAALEDAGLGALAYTHPAGAPWPTLAEMIASDHRFVVGLEQGGGQPAWLHHAWDIFWDTPYSFESASDFSCACNRGCPPPGESPPSKLFLVNHWLSNPLPVPAAAAQTNAFEVLHGRAATCADEAGQQPTLLAVDFYDDGDLFQVVDALNGTSPR